MTITNEYSEAWKLKERVEPRRILTLTLYEGLKEHAQRLMKEYGYRTFTEFTLDALTNLPKKIIEIMSTPYQHTTVRIPVKELMRFTKVTNKSATTTTALLLYCLDLENFKLI